MQTKTQTGQSLHSIGPFRYRNLTPLAAAENRLAQLYRADLGENNNYRQVVLKMAQMAGERAQLSATLIDNESKLLHHLHHRNIVRILPIEADPLEGIAYDAKTQLENTRFFAVEYLSGGSLAGADDFPPPQFEPCLALKIGLQLAEALDYLHQQHYVHMDLKPDHVLFRRSTQGADEGEVVIIDFGSACLIGGEAQATELTQHVHAFVSPERLPTVMSTTTPDIKPYKVEPSEDIYAIGGILYQMLTGRSPFPQSTPQAQIEAIRKQAPPIPSHFMAAAKNERQKRGIEATDQLVKAALHKQKEQRPSAAALAILLREAIFWLDCYTTEPTRVTAPIGQVSPSIWRRLGWLWIVVGALLLASGSGIAGYTLAEGMWRFPAMLSSLPTTTSTAIPTATPTHTATITPSPTVTVTPSPMPTDTSPPTATATALPTATTTPVPTPTSTMTPIPTSTFAPTATPHE